MYATFRSLVDSRDREAICHSAIPMSSGPDADAAESRRRSRSPPLWPIAQEWRHREPQPIRLPRKPFGPQRFALKFNGIVLLPTMTTDPLETVSPTFQQRSRFLKELCSNGLTQVHDAKVLVYWLPGNEASTAATRNQVHSNQNPLVRLDAALPLGCIHRAFCRVYSQR